MIRGFYSAVSSLVSQQANLDTIANNVANISTTGYKPQQTGFSALLYENLNAGAANSIQIGHGVKVGTLGIDFTAGDMKQTDMPYDCAILNDGFFAIEDKDNGDITYTRDGSFHAGNDGKQIYLVNSSGNYVLDEKAKKINLQEGFTTESIGVFTFTNPYGLQIIGGNQFVPTDASGEAEAVKEPIIQSGYLEASSVQLSTEMVRMIEASKSFAMSSKVVQTADELQKIINQLR